MTEVSKCLNDTFPPQKRSLLKSHCKLLLQALAAVGFTASYLKRIVIYVSYHNYQETSSFWENSLVSSPQSLQSHFSIS